MDKGRKAFYKMCIYGVLLILFFIATFILWILHWQLFVGFMFTFYLVPLVWKMWIFTIVWIALGCFLYLKVIDEYNKAMH